jgi:hypothetical protein
MSQTQVSFAGFAKWAMCPETEVPCGSCPSEGLPCQAALYLRQTECPPAGASQEVNEVAPSLAAPSASGQQAGTPSSARRRYYDIFSGVKWVATRRAASAKAAVAALRREFRGRTDVVLPASLIAFPAMCASHQGGWQ